LQLQRAPLDLPALDHLCSIGSPDHARATIEVFALHAAESRSMPEPAPAAAAVLPPPTSSLSCCDGCY